MKFDMILFAGCNVVESLFPTIDNVDITEKFLKDDGLIIFMNSITYNNNKQLKGIRYITPMAPRNLTCTLQMMKFYPVDDTDQNLANKVYNQWDTLFYIDPTTSKYYIYKKINTTSTKYTYSNPVFYNFDNFNEDKEIVELYDKVLKRLGSDSELINTLNALLKVSSKKEQMITLRNYMGMLKESDITSKFEPGRPRRKPNMGNTCFMASALSLLEAAYIHNNDNLFKPEAEFIIRDADYPTNMNNLMDTGNAKGLTKYQQHDAYEALLNIIYNEKHSKFAGSYLRHPITSIDLTIDSTGLNIINFLNKGDNPTIYKYECSIPGKAHIECARHYLDQLKKEHKNEFDNIIKNRDTRPNTSLMDYGLIISERPSDFMDLFEKILIQKYGSEGFRKNTTILHNSYNLGSDYLLFVIKRNIGLTKYVDPIKMPLIFDVNKVQNNSKSQYKYKLLSYIEHQGLTPNVGHYVAYVKNPKTEGWWECNDGIISDIKGPDNINYSMTYLYAREPQSNIVTAGAEESPLMDYKTDEKFYPNEIKLGILGGTILSEYWKQITLVLCIIALLYIIYLIQNDENKKRTKYINYIDNPNDISDNPNTENNSVYNMSYNPEYNPAYNAVNMSISEIINIQ
jgi:hypothetical protein